MSGERARAEMFASLPMETLRKVRSDAAARGDGAMADDVHRAMQLRSTMQTPELENCGQLFEHVEPPCRENGYRHIIRQTGDFMAAYGSFMTGGQVAKINRDPKVVARQTVDLRAGESIQIVQQNGKVRGPG
jgi:hypothetical protein